MIKKTAVCVGSPEDAKRAALYFDSVIHLWLGMEGAPRHPFWPDEIRSNHDASAEFALLSHNHALVGAGDIADRFDLLRPKNPGTEHIQMMFPKSDGSTNDQLEENYLNNVGGVLDDLGSFLSQHGVKDSVFVASSGKSFSGSDTTNDPAVVIAGLKIVDTFEAKWDQISGFREDEDSVRRFRRLSVFMDDELDGKSKSYVEDRIQVELENYEESCSKHGFKLTSGVLAKILDSKSLLAASGATVAAILAGAPLAGIISAPVVVELAQMTISIRADLYGLRETKRLHPMSYIIQAQEQLES